MQQMFTHSHEWMDSILKVKEEGYITSVLNWRYKRSLQIFTSLEEFRCLLLLVQVRRRIECEIKRRSSAARQSSQFSCEFRFPPSPVVMNFENWPKNKTPACRLKGRYLRDEVGSFITWKVVGVEPQEPAEGVGHLYQMAPGSLPGEVSQAYRARRRPRVWSRTRGSDCNTQLSCECRGIILEELGDVSRQRGHWVKMEG